MLKNLGQQIKAAANTRNTFGVTAIAILAVVSVLIFALNSHLPAIYIFIIVLVGFILVFVVYWLHYHHVSKWPPGLTEAALKAAFTHGYTISGTSAKLLPPDQILPSTQNPLKALPSPKETEASTERNE